MKTILKSLAIGFGFIAGLQAAEDTMDVEGATTSPFFNALPEDIHPHILQCTDIMDRVREDGHAGALSSVCKNWYKIIKTNHPSNLPFYTAPHNMEESCLYEIWRHASLRYTKDDGAAVDLLFSVFTNSLTGKLDLSACEYASVYPSISLGYRTAYNPNNANKLEIWICLRDMIQKNINGDAKHYARYLQKWPKNAPIGIFWNWGDCKDVDCWPDYLISNSLQDMLNKNMLDLWYAAHKREMTSEHQGHTAGVDRIYMKKISCFF